MPSIKTLIPDIRKRISSGEPFDEASVKSFANNLSVKLADRLSERSRTPSLRLSNLGTKCKRKLWYSINTPELAEPLSASARLKFLFGDILEEVILFLARAAGHSVEHEQKEVNLHGIRGHIDAVVDGNLVDVKSASTASFEKFKSGLSPDKDGFGYLTQLNGYASALHSSSPEVDVSVNHFIAVDKTLGHLVLDSHPKVEVDYEREIDNTRRILAMPQPPARAYQDKPEGESGNRKLGFECGYCPFKKTCWPGVRAFAYSGQFGKKKIVFLSHVEREPKVPEIKIGEEE